MMFGELYEDTRTDDPPQRLAVNATHQWYDAYWVMRAKVIVNGIERAGVIVADGPGRWAEALVFHHDELGRIERCETVRFEGDVVIVRKA